MQRSAPHLRSVLTTITVLVCAFALLASTGLIVLSAALHETVERLGEAGESIHLAEEAQLALIVHAHATDPLVRRDVERRIRQRLVTAEQLITSEREARALRGVSGQFEAYVAAQRAGAAADQLEPMREATDAAIETLVNVNVAQASADRERAESWDRFANLLGLSTTVLLMVLTVWLVAWLRTRAFSPLFDLARAMRRFAQGERDDARLPEAGPQELRIITRRFNELATTLASQRKAQMAFLAGVAHDLRSPLSAMSLSVATFRSDRPLPPEARIRRAFDMVGRQVARLERMLGDLLDVAKVEAGELELDLHVHDARALVETTVRMFESASQRHRIETDLPAQSLALRCDAMRIEQVLNNLVSNAIKYSPDGGVVRIAARAEGGHVVIEVADRGLGIAKEALPSLFEPFRRGAHRDEGIPGAGLGLYVVRRIVDAHGGTIDVQSARGEGSLFRVSLPSGLPASAVARTEPAHPGMQASS
jgi:signal transduction histidine kinase